MAEPELPTRLVDDFEATQAYSTLKLDMREKEELPMNELLSLGEDLDRLLLDNCQQWCGFPQEFWQLTHLQQLSAFNASRLEAIPDEITALDQLKVCGKVVSTHIAHY